jgi:hypothetical protein
VVETIAVSTVPYIIKTINFLDTLPNKNDLNFVFVLLVPARDFTYGFICRYGKNTIQVLSGHKA